MILYYMVTRIGRWFLQKVSDWAYAAGFFFLVIKEAVLFIRRRQVGFRVLVMQILFTGFEALAITGLIALALGAVIIVQGINLLPQFGQGQLIYTILITVITRELGPLLTAFIITARSGTAIATELGNMVISNEIEAYISVGINPVSYLVVPRFLGVTISLLILNIYFNIFGLVGSYFLTQLVQPIQFIEYFGNLLGQIRLADITSSVVKSLVFGAIISTVATFNGFAVQQASTEIPQKVIKAVGQGFMLIIVADALITMIYYL
jgi:phospholipid/cholesterol/gamma-HCH transport system permease protein